MITKINIQDFALFDRFEWDSIGQLNVLIGENDSGKSILLELMYAVSRSFQDAAAQEVEEKSWEDVLSKKLRWTFQPTELNLSRLIRRGAAEAQAHVELHDRRRPEPTSFTICDRSRKTSRMPR